MNRHRKRKWRSNCGWAAGGLSEKRRQEKEKIRSEADQRNLDFIKRRHSSRELGEFKENRSEQTGEKTSRSEEFCAQTGRRGSKEAKLKQSSRQSGASVGESVYE
ncbi:hypothetical protein NFI96_007366 [Prochilodus magdalenae]|nr:hypothetical protein NFI96_007366 [Prochilodus magdalenae]